MNHTKSLPSHIFAIGDIEDQPMPAHEARVAAEVIAGELQDNTELTPAAFNVHDLTAKTVAAI